MKIAIDCGHGVGKDTGAVGSIAEETIINHVGNLVINKLKSLGHNVVEVRPYKANSVGDSLSQRVNKANSNNCDLFVSIHANAGGGRGTEVFTYGGRNVPQARNVLNNIVSLGFVNRGIKDGSGLYVVKHSNMTAMLIEVCFVDTQSDVDLYNSLGAEKIADSIVKGLVGQTIPVAIQSKAEENKSDFSAHLRDWQSAYNSSYNTNIYVDGIRGTQVEQAMRNAILKVGSRNSLVAWLQCRIGASIDGDFGNNTRQKVIEYQRAHGLAADGIVGYNTWNCLLNQYK